MSDQDVVHSLDTVERMLEANDLDADAIASWRQQYDAALASAARGPGWADIAARAHDLGRRLDLVVLELSLERDAIKKALDLQFAGTRALKGYKPA